ncbi:cytosolic phospholipase A2-like [Paramormyrops kingsleyae]|uniref:cytosolic phospholipase A2-like n=2 Tax=Paramormyrops kingsleyae TaxID=1676925 RepID=UPI003B96C5A5
MRIASVLMNGGPGPDVEFPPGSVSPSKQSRRIATARPVRSLFSHVPKSVGGIQWSLILQWAQTTFPALFGRKYRASKVHSFMQGLKLSPIVQSSTPKESAPEMKKATKVRDHHEFNSIHEPLDLTTEKMYMVDSGLSFNLPYPLILRPERGVDLIISFDYSERESDSTSPFEELRLAEKWAHLNKLPFPKIDPTVFKPEDPKECYVFKPEDGQRNCPTIIHFVLANTNFRNFKFPGT